MKIAYFPSNVAGRFLPVIQNIIWYGLVHSSSFMGLILLALLLLTPAFVFSLLLGFAFRKLMGVVCTSCSKNYRLSRHEILSPLGCKGIKNGFVVRYQQLLAFEVTKILPFPEFLCALYEYACKYESFKLSSFALRFFADV